MTYGHPLRMIRLGFHESLGATGCPPSTRPVPSPLRASNPGAVRCRTNMGAMMDAKRMEAGLRLLAAAQDFWDACHEEGQYGAVQWLEGTNGELLIYTRGEYRQQLMANIASLPSAKVHHFCGEAIPLDDDED